MNISAIKTVATRSLGRMSFVGKKYSPEILTAAGIIGVVAAGVLAARATLKLEEVVDEGQRRVKDVKDIAVMTEEQDEKAVQRQLTAVYTKNALDIVKLYAPSVTLGAASIVCIISAQGIMRKRNIALAAAYKTLESAYSNYREKVAEELGEDREHELALDVKNEKEKGEDGKQKTVKVAGDPNRYSIYAKFFDEYNVNWSKDWEHNLFFLRMQQNFFNEKLQARGHVFLNEVYDALGIERTPEGQFVGWVVSKDGDNYIDFGIYETRNRDFVNGNERSIILDFNVDGIIYDKIG